MHAYTYEQSQDIDWLEDDKLCHVLNDYTVNNNCPEVTGCDHVSNV